MTGLVLASSSPYRRALLERLGIPFSWVAPEVDEEAVQALGLAPEELAKRLARAKAEAVAVTCPQAVVIGSDQVCAFGGQAFGKPGSAAAAAERLLVMAGQEHELITAVCVARDGQVVEFVDVTRLELRPLTREQAERYVELDDTGQVAGGYKLEQRGIALFERIQSEDHTAIVGLPLMRLARVLEGFGVEVI